MKSKVYIMVAFLIGTIILSALTVFAWFSSEIGSITLKTALLDMEVQLYRGIDWDKDGEMDKDFRESEEDDFPEGFSENTESIDGKLYLHIPDQKEILTGELAPGEMDTYRLVLKNKSSVAVNFSLIIEDLYEENQKPNIFNVILVEIYQVQGDGTFSELINPNELVMVEKAGKDQESQAIFYIFFKMATNNHSEFEETDFNEYANGEYAVKMIIRYEQVD